jgi:hypothetical protein
MVSEYRITPGEPNFVKGVQYTLLIAYKLDLTKFMMFMKICSLSTWLTDWNSQSGALIISYNRATILIV